MHNVLHVHIVEYSNGIRKVCAHSFQILIEELVHEIDGEWEVSLVLILSICLPIATEVALIGYNQELESIDGNPQSPHPNSKPLIFTMGGPKGEGNQMGCGLDNHWEESRRQATRLVSDPPVQVAYRTWQLNILVHGDNMGIVDHKLWQILKFISFLDEYSFMSSSATWFALKVHYPM